MKTSYNLRYSLVAYILLMSLFLQGCDNVDINSPIKGGEERVTEAIGPSSTEHIDQRTGQEVHDQITSESSTRREGQYSLPISILPNIGDQNLRTLPTHLSHSRTSSKRSSSHSSFKHIPPDSFPTEFTSAKNVAYQVLPQITIDMARVVQEQTGLVIPFETGRMTTEYLGGKGAFGQLRLCKEQASGNHYGVKILQPDRFELAEAKAEAELQKKLNGYPHLMPIIDAGEVQDVNNKITLYQVMPLASLGNGEQLAEYLKNIKDLAFKEGVLIHVAKSILEGFVAMHRLNIVHLDFKPDNMVIDDKGEVYIIDFGLSKDLNENEDEEVYEGGGKGKDNLDIGLTLLELAVGEDPAAMDFFLQQAKPGSYAAMVKGLLKHRLTPEKALDMDLFKQDTKQKTIELLKEFVQSTKWNKGKEEIRKKRGKTIKELDKIIQQPYVITSVQQLPLPHFTNYVSRPEPERRVIDQLVNGNSPVVACVGMGGIGKSQLLTYLVHHEAIQQRFQKIYWFQAADNETSLLIQYKGLSQELKLPGVDDKTPAEEARTVLIRRLENNNSPTLLVFDNADDPALLATFLPKRGCQVLVSSRSPEWSNKVEVDEFTAEQVGQLLRNLLPGRNTTPEEAKELGEAMGYLPLALNQAIALIREEQKSVGEYLKVYQAREDDLLKTNRQLYGKELPKSVITLYQIQLEKLQKECPAAIDLLEYAALLAPDNIPFSLLSSTLLDKENKELHEIAYVAAIQALFKCALWQGGKDKETFKMHRLIQKVVWLSLQAKTLKLEERLTLIERWIKLVSWMVLMYSGESPYPTKVLAEKAEKARKTILFPHLVALEQVARKEQLLTSSLGFALLLDCLGNHYTQQGAYKKAVSLFEEALKINIAYFGKSHIQTGMTLSNLGNMYGSLGDYKAKKKLLKRALDIYTKNYGENHPETVTTLTSLGETYHSLGSYEKCKNLLEKAFKINANLHREDHPATSTILINLGRAYNALGNNEEAKELLERALKINTNHYGQDHPQTSIALAHLGNAYDSLGKYEQAKESLEKALEVSIKCYGKDHPQTGEILGYLSYPYGNLGNYEKQKEVLEKALKIIIKCSGENHPLVGNLLASLGAAYGGLCEHEKKRELLEKALKIKIRHYGKESLQAGEVFNDLGGAYIKLGNYTKAKEVLEMTLQINIHHYGETHLQTGSALKNLGIVYGPLSEDAKQKMVLKKALKISIKHYGTDHTEIGEILMILGSMYARLYELGRAFTCYHQAHSIFIFIKHKHPDTDKVKELINMFTNISPRLKEQLKNKDLATQGTTALYLAKYQEAKDLLEQSLELDMKQYAASYFNIRKTLTSLRCMYAYLSSYPKKRELIDQALEVNKKLLDHSWEKDKSQHAANYFDISKTLANLGRVYACLGNYQKENVLLSQALEINQKLYGTDHSEIGTTLMHMGISYFYLGAYEKAKEALEQAVAIKNKHGETNYPIAGMILMYLGLAYKALDQPAKAFSCYQQSYSIFVKYPKLPQAGTIKTWMDRMG